MINALPNNLLVLRSGLRVGRILIHLGYGLLLAGMLRITARILPRQYLRIRARWTRRWLAAAVNILGVRLYPTEPPLRGPVLYTANHVSWLDILALAAVLEGDFIAKQEVRYWPSIGWLAFQGGTLFVRRGHSDASARVIEETAFQLKSGRSVILFPEGTTTLGEQVLKFKPRLLRAAILAQVPVQPVALRYEVAGGDSGRVAFVGQMRFVTHLWKVIGMHNVHLHITFGTPLSVIGVHERQLAKDAWWEVMHARQPTAEVREKVLVSARITTSSASGVPLYKVTECTQM